MKQPSSTANAVRVARKAIWSVLNSKYLNPLLTYACRFAAQFATNSSTCTVLGTIQLLMTVLRCTFATHVFFMANHLNSSTRSERCHFVVG
jgi:hypothetical protein